MLEFISLNKQLFRWFLDLSQETCVSSDDKNTTVEMCENVDEARDVSITATLKDDRNTYAKASPLLSVKVLQCIDTHDLNASANAMTEAVENSCGNS